MRKAFLNLCGIILFSQNVLASSFISDKHARTGGFVSGTLVHTGDNDTEDLYIENVMRGHSILSGEGDGDKIRVEEILYREDTIAYKLSIANYSVTLSDDQWVFTFDENDEPIDWKHARDLEIGDRVYCQLFQSIVPLTNIEILDGNTFGMYHLEMERTHTFYVGEMGLLVHNSVFQKVKKIVPKILFPVPALNEVLDRAADQIIQEAVPQFVIDAIRELVRPLAIEGAKRQLDYAGKLGLLDNPNYIGRTSSRSNAFRQNYIGTDTISEGGSGPRQNTCDAYDRRNGTCPDSRDNDLFNTTVLEYMAACSVPALKQGIEGWVKSKTIFGAVAGAGIGCAEGMAGMAAVKSVQMNEDAQREKEGRK